MSAEADILVAGSLHLDVIVATPQLPRLDQTIAGSGVDYAFGGKGGNQAVAAARMGARVAMAGAVGDDAFAKTLLVALARAGVDHAQVAQVAGASGMSVATVLPDGGYTAVIVSGANLAINPHDVSFPDGCKALILQNEISHEVNLALARRAAGRPGLRIILNAAPARATPPELLGLLDLLVVNRGEAADILRWPEVGLDPAKAATALRQMGPKAVVVTLGGDGLVAKTPAAFRAAAFPVRVISTHGAGDAFLGALAAEWTRGATLQQACRFGQAAAALHVSTAVNRRGEVRVQDVRDLIAQSR